MKLIEQLKAGIQLYTAQPKLVQDRPVGFLTSSVKINNLTDYFSNNYVILIKSPCTDGSEIKNNVPIATLYCLERALCSYLLAHGSFYRCDTTKGLAVLNESLYKVVVLQNGREPLEYDEQFISRLIQWLKVSEWESDFPSYIFLHKLICKLGERFHGIPARLTSPRIAHTGYFISKYVRSPDDIHMRLQNFLMLAKTIYNKISCNKFDVIEVQYGYRYRFDQVKRWYLDVEILFGFKNHHSSTTMAEDLEKSFGHNKGLFFNITNEQGFTSITGIRTLSSAPQTDSHSNAKDASDFSSSDDENFIKIAKTPDAKKAVDKESVAIHDNASKASSEPLFGSQSKSSTKDVRDSVEQFMEKWIDDSTDSDINLKKSTSEGSNSQGSTRKSQTQVTPPRRPLSGKDNTPELPKPRIGRSVRSHQSSNGSSNEPTKKSGRSKKRSRTSTPKSNKKKR